MISFFAGKGGVGKTTCAAAFSLRLRGRTLLVSTDPAHSLGDALAVRLAASPRKISGSLWAAELDADRALTRWLAKRQRAFRQIALRGTYLDEADVDSLFRLSLPGVDELAGLIELERLAQGFQHVVVDTAPAGHTLRLLEMPETLSRLAVVLDDLQAKHRAMAASLRGSVRRDAEDAVIDDLARTARALHERLRSDEVEFHWVTLAEELSLAEARDGIGALRRSGIRVTRLIANRVTPAARCTLCSARRAEEARVLTEARDLELPVVAVAAQAREPRGAAALRSLVPRPALGHLTKTFKTLAPKDRRPALPPSTGTGGALELIAPQGARLIFFGGKGGVGKTTAAAAAALALADQGRRVLLLSTDPAHSLGDVLRLDAGNDEREIAPGLFCRELDAAAAFSSRKEQYRRAVDELFETLRGGSRFDAPFDRAVMNDLIELSPPGLDELFGLLAVIDALSRYDVIVVDTAPTGHALRLLELVAKAREWTQVLLQILLKYRPVTGLGHLAKEVTGAARELREFESLLGDPAQARFVVVTRAAALPLLETRRLLSALRELRLATSVVLVNALTPPGCLRCKRAAAEEQRQLDAFRPPRRGWVMLGAPAQAPPPRGPAALRRFGGTWTRFSR